MPLIRVSVRGPPRLGLTQLGAGGRRGGSMNPPAHRIERARTTDRRPSPAVQHDRHMIFLVFVFAAVASAAVLSVVMPGVRVELAVLSAMVMWRNFPPWLRCCCRVGRSTRVSVKGPPRLGI